MANISLIICNRFVVVNQSLVSQSEGFGRPSAMKVKTHLTLCVPFTLKKDLVRGWEVWDWWGSVPSTRLKTTDLNECQLVSGIQHGKKKALKVVYWFLSPPLTTNQNVRMKQRKKNPQDSIDNIIDHLSHGTHPCFWCIHHCGSWQLPGANYCLILHTEQMHCFIASYLRLDSLYFFNHTGNPSGNFPAVDQIQSAGFENIAPSSRKSVRGQAMVSLISALFDTANRAGTWEGRRGCVCVLSEHAWDEIRFCLSKWVTNTYSSSVCVYMCVCMKDHRQEPSGRADGPLVKKQHEDFCF